MVACSTSDGESEQRSTSDGVQPLFTLNVLSPPVDAFEPMSQIFKSSSSCCDHDSESIDAPSTD